MLLVNKQQASFLKAIHSEMKILNLETAKKQTQSSSPMTMNSGNNRPPINNDGEIPDSRADYSLSPYSISVA